MTSVKVEAPSIERLFEMWEQDSKIDSTEPGKELLRIPILHNKYNKLLSLHRLLAKKCDVEYAKLRKLKHLYYSGKLSQEELAKHGWDQFSFLLKSDMQVFIDGDDDLTDIEKKRVYHEECASFCHNIMRELNSRTYQLRSFIEYERFIHGQN